MAGRSIKLARTLVIIDHGLIIGFEASNYNSPFTSAVSRCYFSFFRAKGANLPQNEKPSVNPPVVSTKRLKLLASLDALVDSSRSNKYWPASWFNPFAGVLQREKENLNFESWIGVKLGQKGWSPRRFDFDHHQRPNRGVIRRNYKLNGEKPSVLEGGVKYSVVRVNRNGTVQPLQLRSSQLGLHPRDIDLLSNSTFIPQRATIAVRHDLVLVRMENVRAIVCKDHVLLFDARHSRNNSQLNPVAGDGHRARDAFAQSLADEAKRQPSSLMDPMPFHLRMVECLLEETSNFFHHKVDRLKLVVERMLEELTDDVSMGGLQRLLPLRGAVTEIEHDVRDAHEAMDQVLRSDDNLLALCLCRTARYKNVNAENDHLGVEMEDSRHHPMKQAAADMLLTYQREVDDAGGVLEELRKGMEAAQEIWELGLDTTRNRIIRMNLYISITTLSVGLAALPASFFGMNLPSGFEESPTLFYWVVGGATMTPLALCIGILLGFRMWPQRVDKRRAQDLAGLRDLLQHLDSIDDIIRSVAREIADKALTREEFQKILKSHPSSCFMRQKELDLIFKMFDSNRDGLLEADEWKPSSHKHNESASVTARKDPHN
ncbi:hypothetical protein R1flu_018375 [Riccia fluitans]|uniref:Magnesium transporter n=1 Tax=Riccia fluitans TaxID=41844 RepID=A0ABD1ZFV1_9MARC